MRVGLAFRCMLVLVFGVSLRAGAVSYVFHDIGLPDGATECRGRGINDSGVAVGYLRGSDGRYKAFNWTLASGLTEIAPQAGYRHSFAYAINNSGTIAGTSGNGGNDTQLFLIDTLTGDTTVGVSGSDARCINELGQVAGIWNHASIRDADGTITPIGSGLAYGINNLGDAAGYWYDSSVGDYYAFYWGHSTGRVDLGTGIAEDVNDSGEIVGYNGNKAVVWDRQGNRRYLPTLPGHPNASAFGLNNAGQVVGSLYGLAVVWNADDSVYALDTPVGWGASYARCISENGWVTGEATSTDGLFHAVVWEPVPEPASLVFLAGGLWVFGYRTCRRRRR